MDAVLLFILSENIISNNGNSKAINHCIYHYHWVKWLPLLCGPYRSGTPYDVCVYG